MGSDGYDVFVSYSRADGAGAAELNSWLRSQGLSTFYDRSELRPGLRWIPGLEDAIDRSRAIGRPSSKAVARRSRGDACGSRGAGRSVEIDFKLGRVPGRRSGQKTLWLSSESGIGRMSDARNSGRL
jgi:TIR domain